MVKCIETQRALLNNDIDHGVLWNNDIDYDCFVGRYVDKFENNFKLFRSRFLCLVSYCEDSLLSTVLWIIVTNRLEQFLF